MLSYMFLVFGIVLMLAFVGFGCDSWWWDMAKIEGYKNKFGVCW